MPNKDDARDLGLAIILLCELAGMTRRQLSRVSGIDKGSIADYVEGKTMPTRRSLDRLAAAFGLKPALFDQLIPLCRTFRLTYEHAGAAEPPATESTGPELSERIGSAAAQAMAPYLLQLSQVDRSTAQRARDRSWAETTWRKMETLPAEDHEACVDVLLGDERSWALEERLRTAAEAAGAQGTEESLRLTRLAARVAEHVPEDRREPGRVTRPLYRTPAPPRSGADRGRSR